MEKLYTLLDLVQNNDEQGIRARKWKSSELDSFDQDGLTPLMQAAILGYHRVALALREKGANVDLTDKTGRKAVHYAAKHGHGMVIIMLIEGGSGG